MLEGVMRIKGCVPLALTVDQKVDLFAQKLGREALLWKHLKHPHVLPFLGIDSESFPQEYCMVSPWMKHGTILSHIQRVEPERVDLDRHVSVVLSAIQNQT